jgi:ribosomal protein L7/L12
MVKIELNMSIANLVQARDALKERAHSSGCYCTPGCSVLGFMLQMLEKKLEEVEKVYDDYTLQPSAEEVRLFLAGDRIGAIRKMRERTGAGLKAVKDAVERAAGYLPSEVLVARSLES